ncbi:MAG: DUF447 family protein [Crenarchaeota archaeon]|nr:DUF447 family protein [Thermoproteota archaeon]
MYFLKLSQGILYEALSSFYNSNKKPTATPLGFIITGRDTIKLRIFKNSKTCREILKNRPDIILNLTNNPKLFLIFSFKEVFKEQIENIRFIESSRVNAPKIAPEHGIYGYIECKIENVKEHEDQIHVTLSIENIDAATPYITLEPFSRVINHMIDIAVYLTKIHKLEDNKEIRKYADLLNYSIHIIKDYCSTDLCSEYLNMINKVIKELGLKDKIFSNYDLDISI